jgi:hypothetical protein
MKQELLARQWLGQLLQNRHVTSYGPSGSNLCYGLFAAVILPLEFQGVHSL